MPKVCAYEGLPVEEETTPKSSPSPSSSSRSSAFGSVCKFLLLLTLSCTIVTAIFLGAAYHGAHHLLHHAAEVIIPQVTSDEPLDLPPPVVLSAEEDRDVHERIREFKEAIHQGTTPLNDLELSEREINGLFCSDWDHDHHHHHHGRAVRKEGHHGHDHEHHHHHHDHDMCGKVHVTVSKNQLSAEFSIPLDDHVPSGRGRYFTGTKISSFAPSDKASDSMATDYLFRSALLAKGGAWDSPNDESFPVFDMSGRVRLGDDAVDVRAQSAEVLGWSATDVFVRRFFEGRNLAEGACHHAREASKHIAGIEIGEGKVVIRARR